MFNSRVLIFLSFYVSAKIFTPIGLIITPEENGIQAVSIFYALKFPVSKDTNFIFCQLYR